MLRFTEEEFQALVSVEIRGGPGQKPKRIHSYACAGKRSFSTCEGTCSTGKDPDLRDGNCEHFEQVFIFDYSNASTLTSMSCCMQRLTEGKFKSNRRENEG